MNNSNNYNSKQNVANRKQHSQSYEISIMNSFPTK